LKAGAEFSRVNKWESSTSLVCFFAAQLGTLRGEVDNPQWRERFANLRMFAKQPGKHVNLGCGNRVNRSHCFFIRVNDPMISGLLPGCFLQTFANS
jgi:hypothetical protein